MSLLVEIFITVSPFGWGPFHQMPSLHMQGWFVHWRRWQSSCPGSHTTLKWRHLAMAAMSQDCSSVIMPASSNLSCWRLIINYCWFGSGSFFHLEFVDFLLSTCQESTSGEAALHLAVSSPTPWQWRTFAVETQHRSDSSTRALAPRNRWRARTASKTKCKWHTPPDAYAAVYRHYRNHRGLYALHIVV